MKEDMREMTGRSLEEIERLSGLHCSKNDVAVWLGLPVERMEKLFYRVTGLDYDEYAARQRIKSSIALRERQIKLSESSAEMCSWLGQQWLRQSGRQFRNTRHLSEGGE